jgi:hypothetical protein
MPEHPGSLSDVLTQCSMRAPGGVSAPALADLEVLLTSREDAIADILRLAGVQFGLFPQVVAEVLAEVGLGTAVSPEQRQFIRVQFNQLMQRLRAEYGEQNPPV